MELYETKPGAKLFLAHDGSHSMNSRERGLPPQMRSAFARKLDELLALAGL